MRWLSFNRRLKINERIKHSFITVVDNCSLPWLHAVETNLAIAVATFLSFFLHIFVSCCKGAGTGPAGGTPGLTSDLTNRNFFCIHIISTFVNVKRTKTQVEKCMHRVQSILGNIRKYDAARCQILGLKCTEFDFRWRSAPDSAGRAYSAPTTP